MEHAQIPRFRPGHLYQAEGYVRIPKSGKLVLSVKTQGRVVIKIHDTIVLQRDGQGAEAMLNSAELNLAEGLHPIRIYAKDMMADDGFALSWTMDGSAAPIPQSALAREF